tara:strand:+ start:151 stop:384 length:234 start_codon:yes stop_codon:yes gene_type:complete
MQKKELKNFNYSSNIGEKTMQVTMTPNTEILASEGIMYEVIWQRDNEQPSGCLVFLEEMDAALPEDVRLAIKSKYGQ